MKCIRLPDYLIMLVVGVLSLAGSILANESALFVITGNCYFGQDTGHPIGSGIVYFCMHEESNTEYYSGCNINNPEHFHEAHLNNGYYSIKLNRIKGNYYIRVFLDSYIMQWLDGKNINEQPTPIGINGDTLHYDLHFQEACTFSCEIVNFPYIKEYQSSGEVALLDTFGFEILTKTIGYSSIFTMRNIPLGIYYLRYRYSESETINYREWYYSTTTFYPSGNTLNTAEKLIFKQPNQNVKGAPWVLNEQLDSTKSDRISNVKVLQSDQSTYSSYVADHITSSDVMYSTFSDDTTMMIIKSGEKFFLGGVTYRNDPSLTTIAYYPGTYLRTEAETLSVWYTYPDEPFILNKAEGGRINGRWWTFPNKNVEYYPILVKPNSYQTLGSYPFIYENEFFQLSAPEGIYSLWFVPFTDGYHQKSGYEACRRDNIMVLTDNTVELNRINLSTLQSGSITGSLNCLSNPLIACYDTLKRCVSMTAISIYSYYKERNGERGRCFRLSLINEPATVRYSVNCLPVGKYALVVAEPPSSTPGEYTLSWYGGPSYKRTIAGIDDVASLLLPENVQWISISDSGQIVEIPELKTKNMHTAQNKIIEENILVYKTHRNQLLIKTANTTKNVSLSVFDLSGKQLFHKQFQTQKKSIIIPVSNVFSGKILLCKVIADGKIYYKPILNMIR